jgi:hypothetical protein
VTGLLIALPLLLPPLLRRLRSLGTDRSAKSQDRAGIQLARWPAITASSPLGKNIKA